MKRTNRILSLILALVMVFGVIPMAAFAAGPKSYLAIGDSISTGAALESPETEAFPVLLTEKLNASQDSGEEYVLENMAVNGETTVSLLTRLEQYAEYQEAVAAADLITITIGGNDLMDILYEFLSEEMGIPVEDVKAALTEGDEEFLNEAAAVINEGGFNPTESDIIPIANNIQSIMDTLFGMNEDAIIVISTQYHPYENLAAQVEEVYDLLPLVASEYVPLADAILLLCDTIDTALNSLNGYIENGAVSGGYHVADVYNTFTNSSTNLCNAALTTSPSVSVNMDFHPNAEGHAVIAVCMEEALPQMEQEDPTEPTEPEPTETEPTEPEPTEPEPTETEPTEPEPTEPEPTEPEPTEPEPTEPEPTEPEPTEPEPTEPEPTEPVELPFRDVAENAWYYNNVAFVYEHGYMSGTSATTFSPNQSLTRGMMIQILYRIAGSPEVSEEDAAFFADTQNAYYTDAAGWAKANGIVNGVSATHFGPNQKLTRQDAMTIFYRYCVDYLGLEGGVADLTGFADADKLDAYAETPVAWAVQQGLMSGSAEGGKLLLNPKGNMTRAEAATVLKALVTLVLN